MKKVAVFLAEGFEEIEAIGAIDILRRAEIDVTTVSITDTLEVAGAHNVKVSADKTIKEIDFNNFEVIVLPGGMPGAKNLNENETLKEHIKNFAENGKTIGAICAAPFILGNMRLLEGKKAAVYPGFEPELFGAEVINEAVVVDENITTGRGPGKVFDFALELVEQIAGMGTRKKIEDDMLLTTHEVDE